MMGLTLQLFSRSWQLHHAALYVRICRLVTLWWLQVSMQTFNQTRDHTDCSTCSFTMRLSKTSNNQRTKHIRMQYRDSIGI